jgi:undecaprenyl-diphosphatase
VVSVRFLREPANRRRAVAWMQERAATRWLVVVGRRFRTPARFVWGRLTPGGTFGLEFTSLMAALAVALFVLISYTIVLSGDPGPTGADMTASNIVGHIRADWLIHVAKVITALGSSAVVIPLVLLSAGALASARRWPELGVLVVGTLIILFGQHDLKAAVDRPRPLGSLVDTTGSAFPSGHSAHAVFYLWASLTLVLRLRPGMARATAVVIAVIAITTLIGFSRVYLGAHYLSDVFGGWSLGVAAYAFCAAIALVAVQLGQNERDGAGESRT